MEKITGKNNSLVKNVKKLLSSSRERRAQGLFVLEGARLVFDVLNSLYEVECFLISDSAFSKYKDKAEQLIQKTSKAYLLSDEIADKLGDTQSSQGIFAVCKINNNDDSEISPCGRHIALDNVQDPGNLGAIVRTAEALGMDSVIVSGGCDIYNPKALRASMGSMLRINLIHCNNLADYLSALMKKGAKVYSTSPDSNAQSVTQIDFSNGGVCVIGNEANGVSDEVSRICSNIVTIPMKGKAESLNASVAASIVMWEMLR